MKDLWFALVFACLVNFIGCSSSVHSTIYRPSNTILPPIDNKSSNFPELTEDELAQLRLRIPQILGWEKFWHRYHLCPNGQKMLKPAQTYENDGADWMKNYDKAVNRKVEILIGNITIYQLTVYVPEVGVKMNFNRIGGKYLNLIDTDAICTKVPEAPETRHLTLDLTERRPARDVSQQRNIAEESLIRFIKTNICPHSNKSNFKIPSFNSGDPYVFVLEQSEDEKWVHKIQFQYSFETGEYAPTSSSAFGRPDEIKDIEGLIKKDILLEIDCGHRGMYR